MKIAFILLCHGNVEVIKEHLTLPYFQDPDIHIYVHYDLSMSKRDSQSLFKFIDTLPNVSIVNKRVKCKWGEFSLVQATLNAIEQNEQDNVFDPDYIFLISASCIPIQPLKNLKDFLIENDGIEFIQASDVRYHRWIAGGWDKERYKYYFPFNYYTQRPLFQAFADLQKKLNISRTNPLDINMYFGSQWFCMTKQTCREILKIMQAKKVKNFFRRSWIPDEFAFQSLAVHIAGLKKVADRNLTFFQFNSYGRPLILYDDMFDYVIKQPFFFARKLSAHAITLKEQLLLHSHPTKTIKPWINLKNVGKVTKDFDIHDKIASLPNFALSINRYKEKKENPKGEIKLFPSKNKYFVITAANKAQLLETSQELRSQFPEILFFDCIWNKKGIELKADVSKYQGVSKDMESIRNYDPNSFLNFITNIDKQKVCFCHHPTTDLEITKKMILADRNATVIILKPNNKEENKFKIKKHLEFLKSNKKNLYIDNYLKKEVGSKFWSKARKKSKVKCKIVKLTGMSGEFLEIFK